jgi:uncharacterized membrane protein (DUF4010 family)
MFIYLCHDLWEVIIASFLIYPLLYKEDQEVDFKFIGLAFAFITILTELMSFANYYAFVFIYDKFFKQKR